MRLGDLDALKKQVKELLDLAVKRVDDTPNNSPCYRMYVAQENERARLIDLIDNAPTVPLPDFKEGYKQAILDGKTNFSRPQGKWKLVKDRGNNIDAKCPFCEFAICSIAYNYSIREVKEFIKNKDFDFEFPKFCENCGAEMRGVE